jgi:hypothetical protein
MSQIRRDWTAFTGLIDLMMNNSGKSGRRFFTSQPSRFLVDPRDNPDKNPIDDTDEQLKPAGIVFVDKQLLFCFVCHF